MEGWQLVPAASGAEIAEVEAYLVANAMQWFKFRMMMSAHFMRSKKVGGPILATPLQHGITTRPSPTEQLFESVIEVPNSFVRDDAIAKRAVGLGATEPEATQAASKALFTALFIDDAVRNTTSSKLTLHEKHWKIPLADLLKGAHCGAARLQPVAQIPFATPTSRRDSHREMYRPIVDRRRSPTHAAPVEMSSRWRFERRKKAASGASKQEAAKRARRRTLRVKKVKYRRPPPLPDTCGTRRNEQPVALEKSERHNDSRRFDHVIKKTNVI